MPDTGEGKTKALQLLYAIQQRIADIFGFYFDCRRALIEMSQNLERLQQQLVSSSKLTPGMPSTIADMDKLSFTYGKGDPSDPASVALHSVTQGDLKKRNLLAGSNHEILASSVISLLYSIWNDEFRPEIAKVLTIRLNELSSDIFGDIRLIRNSIIHHDGVALPEIAKCKVLKYFKVGDKIIFSDDNMDDLLFETLKDIDRIALNWLKQSTEFGVKRNVTGDPI